MTSSCDVSNLGPKSRDVRPTVEPIVTWWIRLGGIDKFQVTMKRTNFIIALISQIRNVYLPFNRMQIDFEVRHSNLRICIGGLLKTSNSRVEVGLKQYNASGGWLKCLRLDDWLMIFDWGVLIFGGRGFLVWALALLAMAAPGVDSSLVVLRAHHDSVPRTDRQLKRSILLKGPCDTHTFCIHWNFFGASAISATRYCCGWRTMTRALDLSTPLAADARARRQLRHRLSRPSMHESPQSPPFFFADYTITFRGPFTFLIDYLLPL